MFSSWKWAESKVFHSQPVAECKGVGSGQPVTQISEDEETRGVKLESDDPKLPKPGKAEQAGYSECQKESIE